MIEQDLLTNVLLIKNRYDTIEKHTGDNFNIFRVMRLEQDEVYTHSAVISELLNVKGSHNLGNIFLNVFIDCFNKNLQDGSNPLNIDDWQNSKSFIEVPIGTINNDFTEGGRIDILVKSDNKRIIIENKINALDQKNQLFRYHNYALQKGQEFWLIYLTKYTEKLEHFTTNNNENVIVKTVNLTYKDFVKDWIEKCIPLAFDKPLLRETLRQYLATVKRITNQSTNKEMEQELINLLTSSGNNVVSAMTISNSIEQLKRNLLLKFVEKIKVEVIKQNPQVIIDSKGNLGNKYNGILFSLSNVKGEYIFLSSQSVFSNYYIEISNKNTKGLETKNKANLEYYKRELASSFSNIQNVEKAWKGDWVCKYQKLDDFFNFKSNWGLVADNTDFKMVCDVSQDINKLLRVLNEKESVLSMEIPND